jgi:uncharacterized protein (DUF1778 family)
MTRPLNRSYGFRVVEGVLAVETKVSIERRARPLVKMSVLLGWTHAEFVAATAPRHVIEVLLEKRLFTLDTKYYDAFGQRLVNPPMLGAKLQSLSCRTPA